MKNNIFEESKLFNNKNFKKAIQKKPFKIEEIFHQNYKGGEIKTAKKEKKKGKDKLISSFSNYKKIDPY